MMTEGMTNFVDRYVQMWNDPDPGLRRQIIEELWAPDGANYTESITAVGYDAIEARVSRAHETYVRTGGYRFRSTGIPEGHHEAVKVDWEMFQVADGVVASVGIEFLIFDENGRIASDHQFIIS
jgi:hypothetical protein